ncbi:MAG: ATP-binding protein [Myxococcota bacterium]
MTSYQTLSQQELLSELNRLLSNRRELSEGLSTPEETAWAMHELAVHQVELEMQNRELERTQRAAEEAKNRYRRLYDFAPVGYCSLDASGRVIELNLTAANILRGDRSFCIGEAFEALCPPLKLDSFRTHFAACESRGALVTSDVWVAIEGRGWVPLEFRSEPELRDGRLVGFNTLIIERQREEDGRRLIDDVRRALVNASPHRVNLQAIAELVATRFADVCIIESLDVLGELSLLGAHGSADALRVISAGRPARFPSDTRGAPRVARSGDPEMEDFRFERRQPVAKLGPEYCPFLRQLEPSSYMSVPLRAKAQLLGVLTLVMRETGRGYEERDLRVALELAGSIAWVLENARQLAETQRQIQLRQDLLALVAHDLRTPLNAMRVASELFLVGDSPNEAARTQAGVVKRSVDTMARMIEDLLDFSSVEAGRLSLQREPTDLAEILLTALDMLRPSADKKGISLVMGEPLPAAHVLCDRHRILQVLINLGENAIKFTTKGEVCLSAKLIGPEVHVAVCDSGPGIPSELLPHVFERYWRPRKSANRSGRGLGLFIARGIVEGHDGRIWVESPPGQGARFTFVLPVSTNAEPMKPQATPVGPSRAHGIGHIVLIVEDDVESRSLLRDVLMRKHYRVHTASNGREALELARLVRPEVMLLDLSMPTMDGAQFVRAARADEALRQVPVILVSGDADLRQTARELRVAAWVAKPIQVDSLVTAIESALA